MSSAVSRSLSRSACVCFPLWSSPRSQSGVRASDQRRDAAVGADSSAIMSSTVCRRRITSQRPASTIRWAAADAGCSWRPSLRGARVANGQNIADGEQSSSRSRPTTRRCSHTGPTISNWRAASSNREAVRSAVKRAVRAGRISSVMPASMTANSLWGALRGFRSIVRGAHRRDRRWTGQFDDDWKARRAGDIEDACASRGPTGARRRRCRDHRRRPHARARQYPRCAARWPSADATNCAAPRSGSAGHLRADVHVDATRRRNGRPCSVAGAARARARPSAELVDLQTHVEMQDDFLRVDIRVDHEQPPAQVAPRRAAMASRFSPVHPPIRR